ncbi:hypothetical protein [Catenulispora pinisilvae]|uniref:hypothetical protein n=1 Tax=Catenulispora pinisilvae TaxID=2705253 RepID=UPI0018915B44|nr:hypothetical protein [Catenulispora pinisilvae]
MTADDAGYGGGGGGPAKPAGGGAAGAGGGGGGGGGGPANAADPSAQNVDSSPEDMIGAARSDPLSDARATPDEIAASHAYESFQRGVSAAGPVGVIGGATISGGLHIHAAGSVRGTRAFGPVRTDLLAEIISWYAAAPHDAEIRSTLRERHVVVIRGVQGSGRSTTALKLLSEFAPGQVEWLTVDSGLDDVTDARIKPGHGYLGDLGSTGRSLGEADLDRLSEDLRQREAYCVLLPPAGETGNCPAVYLREHAAPSQGTVLDQRIEAVRSQPRRVEPEAHATLTELSRDRELWALLGSDPGPAEEAWLAELITRLVAGECDRQSALGAWSELIDQRIGEWLTDLPQGVDLHRHRAAVGEFAFRLSLAVLNGSPANLVAEAGERLAWELYTTANPRLTPGRNVFTQLDDDRMARSRATLRDGAITVGDSSAPTRLLNYRDDRLPVRLLAAVWGSRPNLRRPILHWLQDLSQDRRPDVWMRAALAIGLVTSWDFAYCYHEAIEAWAGSESAKQRLVAAAALNQAARDESTGAAVATVLRTWARGDKPELMWTATVAFGYGDGASDLSTVLRLLRRVGVWEEGRLALIVSKSVSDLFARGGFEQVLEALDGWIDDPRADEHILGLLTVLRLGDLRVRQIPSIDDLPLGGQAKAALADPVRADWPLIVAVAQYGASVGRKLVECVWQALSSSLVGSAMRDEIGDWIRAADKSPELLLPLGGFLRGLIDDEDDEARLLDLVDMLAADPDEPLPLRTAHAVRAAVRQSATSQNQIAAAL